MCLHEDHSSTLAERDNQKGEYSHARESTRIVSSIVMLEASSTRCVDSMIMQRFSLSWIFDRTCVKLCTTVMKQILCTSLSLCGRQGIDGRLSLGHDPTFLFLHQGVSIVLGVCEGYDRVEEISEGGIVCTTSSCLPFAFLVVSALACVVVAVVV